MSYVPSNKDRALDSLLTSLTGKDRRLSIEGSSCMTCNEPDLNFRDDLSRREYTISGMCQRCQDSVFDGPEY